MTDIHRPEPVEQVRPEPLRLHFQFEILVGRSNHPYVHRPRDRRADAQEFAVLEDAEEFHLRRERQLADFIEEDASRRRRAQSIPCAALMRR